MEQRLVLNVFGEVQGINFRSMVKVKCLESNLTGFVKNNNDGSVTIEVEGEKSSLEDLIEWLNKNPGFSKVSGLEDYWSKAKGEYQDFKIEYY